MHIELNSFGISLSKENNLFAILVEGEKQLIPPRDVDSISISGGARISSDAILLAIEHEIDVLFVNNLGLPQGRVWSHRYGSISTIRKNQIEFIYSSESVDWIKSIIIEKINNQIATLLALDEDEIEGAKKIRSCLTALTDYKQKISALQGKIISDIAPSLRGWEGASSKRYFEMIGILSGPKYQFKTRSQHPATDPFNALLNYGYGILYGKVEGALIKAGLDPYVGILHRDDYNRPVLVYDFIEKYRHWVDFVVVRLCQADAFDADCFSYKGDAVWLVGLGKRILIQSIYDYLAEIIRMGINERSRAIHIEMEAKKLAQYFLKFRPDSFAD